VYKVKSNYYLKPLKILSYNLMNSIKNCNKMYLILVTLVLIGAINWGTTAFGYNLVNIIKNTLNKAVGMETYLDKIIYVLVALAAVKLASNRDFWLPFLGKTVLPSSLIPLKNIVGDTTIEVNVSPNTKVAYWASLPQKTTEIPKVENAYGDYKNAGVVLSDKNGIAKLIINKGTNYIVPDGKEISRHVHYRELDQDMGFIGKIYTHYY
jgi:uncharacterized membrane protein YuzA (DUF378 family)